MAGHNVELDPVASERAAAAEVERARNAETRLPAAEGPSAEGSLRAAEGRLRAAEGRLRAAEGTHELPKGPCELPKDA